MIRHSKGSNHRRTRRSMGASLALALVVGGLTVLHQTGTARADSVGTISTVYADANGNEVKGLDWSDGKLFIAANQWAVNGWGNNGTLCAVTTADPAGCADIPLVDSNGQDTFTPYDVKVGPDGLVYFTSPGEVSGYVDRVAPDGSSAVQVVSSHGWDMQEGGWLAFDSSGNLYVSQDAGSGGSSPVREIAAPAASVVPDTATVTSLVNSTLGTAGDSTIVPLTTVGTQLWAAAQDDNLVSQYQAGWPMYAPAGPAAFLPTGLVADAAGNLFMATDSAGFQIWELYGPNPPAGKATDSLALIAGDRTGSDASTAPAGTSATAVNLGNYLIHGAPMAIDSSGNLYVGAGQYGQYVYEIHGVAQSTQALTATVASGAGNGSGSVVCAVKGVAESCGTAFPTDTSVTLTATPTDTSTTTPVWSGCDSVNSDGTCDVTMSADRTVTVTFAPILSAAVSEVSTGQGAVVSSTAGSSINCGDGNTACSEGVAYVNGLPGTEILTAVPADTHSYFSGWTNCDDQGVDSATSQCTVTVDQAKTVTATFLSCPVSDCSPVTLTVGADPSSTGQGQISGPTGPAGALACSPAPTSLATVPAGCSAEYPYGAVVSLQAEGIGSTDVSTILGWNVPGCPPATATCQVTVTRDSSGNTVLFGGGTNPTVTGPALVRFGTGSYTLHIRVSGAGSVTLSPTSLDSTCAGSCDESYDGGTQVTVTAVPGQGQSFSDWGGSCSSTNEVASVTDGGAHVCTVTMTGSVNEFTVTPNFNPNSYSLAISPSGAGSGTVTSSPAGSPSAMDCPQNDPGVAMSCAAFFPYGTPVTLTATPAPGSQSVASFPGPCQTTTADPDTGVATCTVTVTSDTAEPVTFGLAPPVAAHMTLTMMPSAIQADGQSQSTADIYITDQYGNPLSGQHVGLTGVPALSTDHLVDVNIGSVAPGTSAGNYLATITASTRPSQQYLIATDSDAPSIQGVEAKLTLQAAELPAGSAQLAATYTPDPSVEFSNADSPARIDGPDADYTVQVSVPAGTLPAGTQLSIFSANKIPNVSGLRSDQTLEGAIGIGWTLPPGQVATTLKTPIVVLVHKQVPQNLANDAQYLWQLVGNELAALVRVAQYGSSGETIYFGATPDPNHPGSYVCDTGCTAVNNTFASGGTVFDTSQTDASNFITAGGGNLITAGGGNFITAGGGNLITAGGGNLITAGGGNLITAGGGNLITAGGGNLITAGGGNLRAHAHQATSQAGTTCLSGQPCIDTPFLIMLTQDPAFAFGSGPVGGTGSTGGTTGGILEAAGATFSSSSAPPSPSNPVVVRVTTPVAGMVDVESGTPAAVPAGYEAFGSTKLITAPTASSDHPLVLNFDIDRSALPAGVDDDELGVTRDGLAAVTCPGATTVQGSLPCVSSVVDHGSYVTITVLSTHASLWSEIAATADRIAGADRVGTSVATSQAYFGPGQAKAAVLARDDVYPDALAGAPLAAAKGGPLMLTDSANLSASVGAELARALAPGSTVYLLGGDEALSPAVEQAVGALGFKTVRLAGADRYATAVSVAGAIGHLSGIMLADGMNFPDALSAGPAAAHLGAAILLTSGSSEATATGAFLAQHPGLPVYAIGGPAATADPTASAVVGSDRYATAVAVAHRFFPGAMGAGLASGLSYADALAAGPVLGAHDEPLLLTDPHSLTQSTGSYLQGQISQLHIFGGTAAVTFDPVPSAPNTHEVFRFQADVAR